jgi:hypothetical protein
MIESYSKDLTIQERIVVKILFSLQGLSKYIVSVDLGLSLKAELEAEPILASDDFYLSHDMTGRNLSQKLSLHVKRSRAGDSPRFGDDSILSECRPRFASMNSSTNASSL